VSKVDDGALADLMNAERRLVGWESDDSSWEYRFRTELKREHMHSIEDGHGCVLYVDRRLNVAGVNAAWARIAEAWRARGVKWTWSEDEQGIRRPQPLQRCQR
jgi:hypothetical protein